MGWLFSQRWATKQDLVEHLNSDVSPNYTLIASRVTGNRHWQVVEGKEGSLLGAGNRLICLNLMQSSPDGWGYKEMDETAHPYYYDCPLSLLDVAPQPVNEQASRWREKVREHHAQKSAVKALKLNAGDILTYGGTDYRLHEPLGRRGWGVIRVSDGCWMRMNSRQVNEAARKLLKAEAA